MSKTKKLQKTFLRDDNFPISQSIKYEDFFLLALRMFFVLGIQIQSTQGFSHSKSINFLFNLLRNIVFTQLQLFPKTLFIKTVVFSSTIKSTNSFIYPKLLRIAHSILPQMTSGELDEFSKSIERLPENLKPLQQKCASINKKKKGHKLEKSEINQLDLLESFEKEIERYFKSILSLSLSFTEWIQLFRPITRFQMKFPKALLAGTCSKFNQGEYEIENLEVDDAIGLLQILVFLESNMNQKFPVFGKLFDIYSQIFTFLGSNFSLSCPSMKQLISILVEYNKMDMIFEELNDSIVINLAEIKPQFISENSQKPNTQLRRKKSYSFNLYESGVILKWLANHQMYFCSKKVPKYDLLLRKMAESLIEYCRSLKLKNKEENKATLSIKESQVVFVIFYAAQVLSEDQSQEVIPMLHSVMAMAQPSLEKSFIDRNNLFLTSKLLPGLFNEESRKVLEIQRNLIIQKKNTWVSSLGDLVSTALDQLNLKFKQEVVFKGIEIDFILFLENGVKVAIELQGRSHYFRNRKMNKGKDLLKKKILNNYQIQVSHLIPRPFGSIQKNLRKWTQLKEIHLSLRNFNKWP